MTAPHMPMMNEEGILECPLCQATIAHADSIDGKWVVECYECGCRSGVYMTGKGAIESWNTRNGHLYTADDFNQAAQERDYGL